MKLPAFSVWLSAAWRFFRPTPYLYPANADQGLRETLDGVGEEEGDGQSDGAVQAHGNKHPAGWDGVPQENVDGEGHKDDDLTGREEGGHVEASQVGAAHDLWDFLSVETRRERLLKNRTWCDAEKYLN